MTHEQNNLININITPDYKDKVAEQEMSAGALRRRLYNTKGTESYENALRKTQQHLSDHLSGDVSNMSKTQIQEQIEPFPKK